MNIAQLLQVIDRDANITVRRYNTGEKLYTGKSTNASGFDFGAIVIGIYTANGNIIIEI